VVKPQVERDEAYAIRDVQLWYLRACVVSLLAHVKEAKARQAVVDEQLLLDKLMFHLAELHGAHLAAIGSQFARGVFLEANQQFLRSRGGESCKEFLFEYGEGTFEGFQILRRSILGIGCAEFRS
jgi:hypothetical protein